MKKLTRKWRGPSDDAIDVFIVHDFGYPDKPAAGRCRINTKDTGCPKHKDRYNTVGCVIGLRSSGTPQDPVSLGTTIAHEIGHHLGLFHSDDVSNLMYREAAASEISGSQAQVMRAHCSIRDGC